MSVETVRLRAAVAAHRAAKKRHDELWEIARQAHEAADEAERALERTRAELDAAHDDLERSMAEGA